MRIILLLTRVVLIAATPILCQAQGETVNLLEEFKNPPIEFYSAPLWVWNDEVTEDEIDRQLDMFASQKVLQAFVHPRPGLVTPYLSERWLGLFEHAVKSAKERGMLLHIYDENSYPSGFAGGHVPALRPEWAGKGIVRERVDTLPNPLPQDVLAAYRLENGEFIRAAADPDSPQGPFWLMRVKVREPSPWNGGFPYVDLLQPGVVELFLQTTLEPYRETFGTEFGETVRWCFTDEPHLRPTGDLHWTPDLGERFAEAYGYDLLDSLPSLFEETGDWRRVRFDFHRLLLDLFIERWARPYFEACEELNLDFTGHYWEHDWPRPTLVPDNMAMAAWQQAPGIDCLMNRYDEGVHSQFGNIRAVKEIASVANQLGYSRRLCEVYGAGGWEMTFADQKRIAEWLGVHGVNFFNQHLSYMTLLGPRKRDHPLSFSDHAPWWPHYRLLGERLARLSRILSSGEEINRVLVIEPTTSGWLRYRAGGDNTELDQFGEEFQSFVTDLSLGQVEYDLGSERVLRDHAVVEGNSLRVGLRVYDDVVLHRTCDNLAPETWNLLAELIDSGGTVVLVGGRPHFVGGVETSEMSEKFPDPPGPDELLVAGGGGRVIERVAGRKEAIRRLAKHAAVQFPEFRGGKLFHQYRELSGGGLLFLVNTDDAGGCLGKWRGPGASVRSLDLQTGEAAETSWTGCPEGVEVDFDLPPLGSSVFLITDEKATPRPPANPHAVQTAQFELIEIEPTGPNVLPLDYCDYQVSGGVGGTDVYFYRAQTAVFQARGFDRNPWDNAVQFKERLLERDRDFAEGSGFEIRHRFEVEGFETPLAIRIAVEQAAVVEVFLNGVRLQPNGEWWLDRQFGVLDSGEAVRNGNNEILLQFDRFSVRNEIEPIYLLGDFSLKPTERGWTVAPPSSLAYGPWNEQGRPFDGGGVRYRFEVDSPPEGCDLLKVVLPDWRGTVAVVRSGESEALVAWPPYEVVVPAGGAVEIEVLGSLKNPLGPHHENPALGTAWPGQFQKAPESGPPPGRDFHTLPYGLMKPPTFEWLLASE